MDGSQLLASQIERCKAPPYSIPVEGIARCRSSAQCPDGELCCDEFMWSGASAWICKPAEASEQACSYGEVCTPDLPCRNPGTQCVKGTCRRGASVECGERPCDLRTHTCVVPDPSTAKPTCITDAELDVWRKQGRPIFDVGCTRQADCQPGERCRYAQARTFCQRADDGMSGVVCDSAADCPKDLCAHSPQGHTRIVCSRDPDDWHALCGCQ